MQNLHQQINQPGITTHEQAGNFLRHLSAVVRHGRKTTGTRRYPVTANVMHYAPHITSHRTTAQDKRRAAKARNRRGR